MKHFQNIYIVLLSTVLLIGCRVGREYQRPEVELPAQFNTVAFADTSSIANISWREFFTDTHLQELVERGLKYNHDLLIAANRIDIAEQQLAQAKVLRAPELDIAMNAQYNRLSNNSINGLSTKTFLGNSHIENYTAIARLSWEVDIWGKIRSQKEITLANYLKSHEGVRAVQTALVANIAQGYFNLQVLDGQLAIARRTLILNDSFVVATRLLKDAGLTNALAVQQAEAQKLSTALLIPQLEENIALQENALQLLTGQLPGKITRTRSMSTPVPKELQTGMPAALLSRRPDVRSRELELQISNAQVGISQANMYPALNLTVGAGLESFKSSNWFNIPGSLFGLAAGSLAQPVFKRRSLRTAYEISKIEREQAVTAFRQSVLQAVTEVSNALVLVDKARLQEVIAKEQVAALQSAISHAQLLFKSDMANYLEVITAQSNALQAELNMTAIQGERWKRMVELYRALGGGGEE